jgi:ribosomal protein L7/L12
MKNGEMESQTTDLPAEAIDALWQGSKIEAIKIVRRARNLDLKGAKDKVEEYLRNNPALRQKLATVQAETRAVLVRWLVILAVLAIGGYFLAVYK